VDPTNGKTFYDVWEETVSATPILKHRVFDVHTMAVPLVAPDSKSKQTPANMAPDESASVTPHAVADDGTWAGTITTSVNDANAGLTTDYWLVPLPSLGRRVGCAQPANWVMKSVSRNSRRFSKRRNKKEEARLFLVDTRGWPTVGMTPGELVSTAAPWTSTRSHSAV